MRYRFLTAPLLLASITTVVAEPTQRTLSIEDRVKAQEAIERVYWDHRIWPKDNPTSKPPLSAVISDGAIRARVEDDLRKSSALERVWHRAITGPQLQAEIDRMTRSTKQPEVLREIFAALRNDPLLIAETLARPILSERLIRNWYAHDERFQRTARQAAEDLLSKHPTIETVRKSGFLYTETRYLREASSAVSTSAVGTELRLGDAEWSALLGELTTQFGNTVTDETATLKPGASDRIRPSSSCAGLPTAEWSPLQESESAFYATAIVACSEDSVVTASVVSPKMNFESWWKSESKTVEPMNVVPTALYRPAETLASGCADDTWSPIAMSPIARSDHRAVWTGTEMIVWGGYGDPIVGYGFLNEGGRYNPATDKWMPMSAGPEVTSNAMAIWTGQEMVTCDGRYDPATDRWRAANILCGPAVWTGNEVIVWDGTNGSRYNPTDDSQTPVTSVGAPSPRAKFTLVWTGSEAIVWGGVDPTSAPLNTGARYSPDNDTWVSTSIGDGVPTPRFRHAAVWTGTKMIVWGRQFPDYEPGGRYDPSSDSWSPMSTNGAPEQTRSPTAVWTGTEMLVFGGGIDASGSSNVRGRYNPVTDVWNQITAQGVPSRRSLHTAVWTGKELIIWGGKDEGSGRGVALNTGGRYEPLSDSWIPTSVSAPVDAFFTGASGVWTGTELIVWGGYDPAYNVGSGARYFPATDHWIPMSLINGPVRDDEAYAIPSALAWTGEEMWVCGSYYAVSRYLPATDSWLQGPGGPCRGPTALWSGSELLASRSNVWSRYDPTIGSWANVNPAGAASTFTPAVWSGIELVAWGGGQGSRYEPSTDLWTPINATAAPAGGTTAVWAGDEMLVWDESTTGGGAVSPVDKLMESHDSQCASGGTSIESGSAVDGRRVDALGRIMPRHWRSVFTQPRFVEGYKHSGRPKVALLFVALGCASAWRLDR
jgi:N-acetylneuraminic acid mutarotase